MKKNLNRIYYIFSVLLLLAFAMGGCKKKDVAPKPTPALPNAQSAAQLKPQIPAQKPISTSKVERQATATFTFKKDPFKPLITQPEASATKAPLSGKGRNVDILPIQSHEVNKFLVTGIITGLKENKALVVDPTGKGYVVKTGMLMGDSDGRITKITSSSLEVTERYIDEKKRIKSRIIVLPLAKKSKEISR